MCSRSSASSVITASLFAPSSVVNSHDLGLLRRSLTSWRIPKPAASTPPSHCRLTPLGGGRPSRPAQPEGGRTAESMLHLAPESRVISRRSSLILESAWEKSRRRYSGGATAYPHPRIKICGPDRSAVAVRPVKTVQTAYQPEISWPWCLFGIC